MPVATTIKVIVIDDSRFIARKLEEVLSGHNGIDVVGKAHNGEEALDAIERLSPDCITLDVHMPGMNGLTVLKHIMIRSPTPTLMVSSYTSEGSWVTFDALRYGAVDFYKKPSGDTPEAIEYEKKILIEKVIRASRVRVEAARFIRVRPKGFSPSVVSEGAHSPCILIGGTGGYAAILQIFSAFSKDRLRPCHIFLDVPLDCLKGFSRYMRASFGIKTHVIEPGRKEMPGGEVLLFNNEEVVARYKSPVSTVVLSGEKDTLERFEAYLAVREEERFALDPSLALVPEMSEHRVNEGCKGLRYADIARLLGA